MPPTAAQSTPPRSGLSTTTGSPQPSLLATSVLAWGLACAIILGSVFGYDFFNQKVAGIPLTSERFLVGLLVAAAVFWISQGRLTVPRLQPVDLFLLFFIGLIAFNLVTTDWRFRSNKPLAQFIFYYLMPLGLYGLARLVGHEKHTWTVLRWTMVTLGVYLGCTAVCETREWSSLIFPRYIITSSEIEFLGRGRGPFLNPVGNGIYMITSLACGLTLWRTAGFRLRLGLAVIYLVLMAGIFCTLTRSIWLAAAPVMAGYIWKQSTWQWRGIFVAGFPVAVGILLVVAGDKFNAIKRDKHVSVEDMKESASLRPLLALVAQKMIVDRPILGYGLGQYPKHAKPYHFRDAGGVPLQKVLVYVQHNTFLAYAVELGLLGLTAYLITIGLFLWMSLRLLLTPSLLPDIQDAAFITLSLMWAFLFNALAHDVAIINMTHFLLFIFLGLQASLFGFIYPSTTLCEVAAAEESSVVSTKP